MTGKNLVAALGAVALVASTVAVQPAVAQQYTQVDGGEDAALWLVGWGIAGGIILALVLSDNRNVPPPAPTPVSP